MMKILTDQLDPTYGNSTEGLHPVFGHGLFVDARQMSKQQVKSLAKYIIKELGVKPRFSLGAAMDVFEDDLKKEWPANHELLIGIRRAKQGYVFSTQAPADGGYTRTTLDDFYTMTAVVANSIKRQAESKEQAANFTFQVRPF